MQSAAEGARFVPGPLPTGAGAGKTTSPDRSDRASGGSRSSSDYFDADATARAAADDEGGGAATIGLHGCVLDQERRIAELDVIVRDLRVRIEELEKTILDQYAMLNDKYSFSLPWKRP